jgi:hypothetical protein
MKLVRKAIRNESNASRSRGFPAVVPWVGDTSNVSSGDGMMSNWEVGFLRGITRKAEGALPISDRRFGRERPGEHFWAAKPHKHRGRSRPNRGFRLRSFCRLILT